VLPVIVSVGCSVPWSMLVTLRSLLRCDGLGRWRGWRVGGVGGADVGDVVPAWSVHAADFSADGVFREGDRAGQSSDTGTHSDFGKILVFGWRRSLMVMARYFFIIIDIQVRYVL
jgi:hypothetical protein